MNSEKAQCPLKARTNTFTQLVYHDLMFSFIQPFRWVLASFTTWHVLCQVSLLERVVLLSSEGRPLSSLHSTIFHPQLIQCTGAHRGAHRRTRAGRWQAGLSPVTGISQGCRGLRVGCRRDGVLEMPQVDPLAAGRPHGRDATAGRAWWGKQRRPPFASVQTSRHKRRDPKS